MILKKRDLYIFLILSSLVGYAVIQRLSNQSENAPEHLEADSNEGFETTRTSRSPGPGNISAVVGR